MTEQYLDSTTQSVSWFKQAYDENRLDLRPPYQRNPVWLEPQQAFLIDSILRSYPVPELYLQIDVDGATGVETVVVVDGQQRLCACLEFIDGGYPLVVESRELAQGEDPLYPGFFFEDLPDEAKRQIWSYTFVVRKLPPNADETEHRRFFARLNRNTVALNKQELRHATYWGGFISLMETIADDRFWSAAQIFTPNDIRRMLDVEYVSELALAALHGPLDKKTKLDDWYEAYEADFSDRDQQELAELFRDVLAEIRQLLPDLSQFRWSKKSDFYSLLGALSRIQKELPLASDARASARTALVEFSQSVDVEVADFGSTRPKRSPKRADKPRLYAVAVNRAANDLANRREREGCVTAILEDVLQP